MGVPNANTGITYDGDGSTYQFATNFTFAENSEVEAVHTDSDGVETTWVLGTQYSLSGAGTGNNGTLTVILAPTDYTPAVGETLTLRLKPALTQPTSLPRGGNVSPKDVLEPMFDKRVRQLLYLHGLIKRAMLQPINESDDPIGPLPSAASRAGKALTFDANGDPTAAASPFPTTLDALKFPRVNSGGTAYELISAAAVLTAIGGQPLDSDLTAIAALSTTSYGRAFLALADEAAFKAYVNLEIGTDVQAANANLSAVAALSFIADRLPYGNGSGTLALTPFTSAARDLLDDADAGAMRTTLGMIAGGAGDVWVEKAGDTMTGDLTLAADPTSALHAATKQYVDTLLAGVAKRGTVRAASTATVTLATDVENGDSLDGVTLATDDLILLKNQSAQAENGVYKVNASGAPTRATQYDTWAELIGSLVTVQEGTTNADTMWLCTANTGGTLGSTAVTFSSVYPGSGGTVTNIATTEGVQGGTITSTGTLKLDFSGLTANSAPALTDVLAFYLAASSVHRKITFQQVFNLLSSLTALTSPATADTLLTYDSANSVAKGITFANLMKLINSMTEDTSPDTANDFVLTYDASASAVKKVKPSNLAPSGGLTLLHAASASNSATIDLETTLDSTYEQYVITWSNFVAQTDNVYLLGRVKVGGSYLTSSYKPSGVRASSASGSGASAINVDNLTSGLILQVNSGNASTAAGNGAVIVSAPTGTSRYKPITGHSSWVDNSGEIQSLNLGGAYTGGAGAVTGFQLVYSSGNIVSGEAKLYGLKKS